VIFLLVSQGRLSKMCGLILSTGIEIYSDKSDLLTGKIGLLLVLNVDIDFNIPYKLKSVKENG
jgi:hypothetical protein